MLPYESVLPRKNSGLHRYVFLLMEQQERIDPLDATMPLGPSSPTSPLHFQSRFEANNGIAHQRAKSPTPVKGKEEESKGKKNKSETKSNGEKVDNKKAKQKEVGAMAKYKLEIEGNKGGIAKEISIKAMGTLRSNTASCAQSQHNYRSRFNTRDWMSRHRVRCVAANFYQASVYFRSQSKLECRPSSTNWSESY